MVFCFRILNVEATDYAWILFSFKYNALGKKDVMDTFNLRLRTIDILAKQFP